MLARWVTWLESRTWPSPWRETCRTSAPPKRPSETSAAPTRWPRPGPAALEARQRVRAGAGDDPDRHAAPDARTRRFHPPRPALRPSGTARRDWLGSRLVSATARPATNRWLVLVVGGIANINPEEQPAMAGA